MVLPSVHVTKRKDFELTYHRLVSAGSDLLYEYPKWHLVSVEETLGELKQKSARCLRVRHSLRFVGLKVG